MTWQKVTLAGHPVSGVDAEGVDWRIRPNVEGWWGGAPVSHRVTDKPAAPGVWIGTSSHSARSVTLAGVLVGPTQQAVAAALDTLNALADLDDAPLQVETPAGVRIAWVRRDSETLTSWASDLAVTFSVSLIAADPRLYGPVQRTVVLPVSQVGGIRYPLTYPLRYHGVGAQSSTLLVNAGNAAAPVRLVAHGPLPDGVRVVLGSRTLAFDMPLFAGQSVVLDGRSRTASIGGVDMSQHLSRREWVDVPAGGSLRVSLVGRTGGGWVDVEWADTWL